MEKILITGSDGFFASRFSQYYKDAYEVIALNRYDLDITNSDETMKIIKSLNPSYLVHAAAISDTGICERDPVLSFEVNVKGSINIARACAESKTKLIYLSSDQIYNGNIEEGPYDEEHFTNPNTVYGNHKKDAEVAIAEIMQQHVILRLTWLFSLPEKNKKTNSNIIWNITKSTMKNEPLKLPVNEYRGITYVYDLIENFNKIIHLPKGIYNTGSENNLSTYEIGEIVLNKMGIGNRIGEILIKDTERYSDHIRDLRINNNKLMCNGIFFNTTEEAVSRCIDEFLYKIN